MKQDITVAGMIPLTTIDYPGGMLSAVLFLQGCPWRCTYCHNPHLLPIKSAESIAWSNVVNFLKKRQGILDAVVFSGGEPTVQKELGSAMQDVHTMGFKVGLHTAGIYPQHLEKILPLIDWVGMDIKGPFASYEKITGVVSSGARAQKSMELILKSKVAYEFRTTLDPWHLGKNELLEMAHALKKASVKHYALQAFRPLGVKDIKNPEKQQISFEEASVLLRPFFKNFTARPVE